MTEPFGTRDTEYQALFLIRSYRSRRPLPYYEKKKKNLLLLFTIPHLVAQDSLMQNEQEMNALLPVHISE